MIWNANLDRAAAQRKTPTELRTELKRWEDEQARVNRQGRPQAPAIGVHVKANRGEFQKLVALARQTAVGQKERTPTSSETEAAA
jgi:hypothetical protein